MAGLVGLPLHNGVMKESDLYPPVKAWLEGQGYTVKGEIGAADVVAYGAKQEPVIVELKKGFSLSLYHQGITRLSVTDQVYLCVSRPKGKTAKRMLKDNTRMARRLGLGLLTVRERDGFVDVLAKPGPYAPRKSKAKAKRLRASFDRITGDPNAGGATRHGIVTGYRQDAIRCARFLAVHGASKGSVVADWTEVPPATRIMRDNHYGWFKRVAKGVYDLTPEGRKGLEDWAASEA